MVDWSQRKVKQVTREIVLDCPARKSVLLLPSDSFMDYQEGVKQKVIAPNTKVIFVERNKRLSSTLQGFTPPRGYQSPDVMISQLADVKLPRKVDFAWIDLCGNLTVDEVEWLRHELVPNIMANCVLAFTFSTKYRHNKFIENGLVEMQRNSTLLMDMSLTLPLNVPPAMVPITVLHLHILREVFGDSWKWKTYYYRETVAGSPDMLLYVLRNESFVQGSIKMQKCQAVQRPKHLTPQQWAWDDRNPNGIRATKYGVRPPNLTPQQWAWDVRNPNGIRANKAKAK